ncbi:pentatricopeptide repeat-containing protein At1g71060, mitochondrial-like [Chenopodium quinoa]|uniref:Pentatricopeptide repeat-containing protein n=1 Tax=Chenopodium quinoa TaxID=63459 RepID=A0A803N2Z8_CHEQI|nr:pentatricopeptide repeat-containing protein At1g71060, mitochondrial-like [Chenopodium quinoa]
MAFSRILSRHLATFTKLISSSPQFSNLTTTPLKNPVFSSLFAPIHPILLINANSVLFNSSIHGSSTNTPVIPKAKAEEENKPTQLTPQIIIDSEKICKKLLNIPKDSTIESTLENCGVEEMTPILVLEVLKKLSNAGVLALGFFKWAEKQKGFKHTNDCYNALIDSLGKVKQFSMIWSLVESMKSKGILTKYTFNLIIRRYARARRVEYAVSTFEKMEKYGMTIDSSDFNKFLDTLCKSRQVKDAHKVFDEMKKRRFTPDKKSYSILLEGWGQQQNFLKLDEVYREMKEEGFELDVVAYGIIMNAYCKARKVSLAVEKLQEMEAKGIEPSGHIYCILINGLGSDGRLGEALKMFEMSKANGVAQAPTYNAVVCSYCWSLRFDEAFRMVDEMRRCKVGLDSRTYDIIIHHLVKAGKHEEAYSVFLKMSNDQGCDPTTCTYGIIMRMFCSKGELDKAVKIWNEMKAKGVIPAMHMFATMISSFRQANKLEDACKYFDEMMDLGIRPPAIVYSKLKQALLDEGKKDTAQSLTLKFNALRFAPNPMKRQPKPKSAK